jgi:hypothetical protein
MNSAPNKAVDNTCTQRTAAGPIVERRVLVFPAGTEIGLEIYASLKNCKNIALFGAGEDISNHARFAYPEYHTIPNIHTAHWLDELISICHSLRISHIFPAHDDVIVALSEAREKIPATLIISDNDTCTTTRSKSATYRRLANALPVPHVYAPGETIRKFPLFVKPDRGQGSINAIKVEDNDQLASALYTTPGGIVCDYLPGEEYTVDCFSSLTQGLLFAGARSRNRTRNGISVNSKSEDLPEAWPLAKAINSEFKLRGAWFFQLKRDINGVLTLLEVAPRIAGSMATHRVTGVNFALLSLLEQEGMDIVIAQNIGEIELDRSLNNRYLHHVHFKSIYIDLDDTLISNGSVNADLIKLIFTSINLRKEIVLITRHRGDLAKTLGKHRLTDLFDKVIHITDGSPKSKYICSDDAIFRDDSFSERLDVSRVCCIPTFDLSMIEILCQQAEPMNEDLP